MTRGVWIFLFCGVLVGYAYGTPPVTGGTITGRVTDPGGHPLPGVTVILRGPALPHAQVSVTDIQGRYQLKSVPPGRNYRLRVELPGFPVHEKTDIEVWEGATVTVDFVLRPVGRAIVVITPARQPTPPEAGTPPVQVFTGEDIFGAPGAMLDDRLQVVPTLGAFRRFSSRVGHPTTRGVTFRGMRASGVSRALVLLDDIPINDPFGGWIYWNRIPQTALHRVEVVPTPVSSAWGNFGMGGAVHLRTVGPEWAGWAFELSGGEREAVDVDTTGQLRLHPRATLLLSGRFYQTDGYFLLGADQRGPIDVPADTRFGTALARLVWYPTDRTEWALWGNWFSEERGNGTPLRRNETDVRFVGTRFTLWTAGNNRWDFQVFMQSQTFRSSFTAVRSDRTSERPALDQFDVPSTALGFRLQWMQPGTGWAVGLDLTRVRGETREAYRWLGDRFANERTAGGIQAVAGLYVQRFWRLHPRVTLSTGIRVDSWWSMEGFRQDRRRDTGFVFRDERYPDRQVWVISPSVGIGWQPISSVNVRLWAGRGFRAPTLNELYRPFRVRNVITAANAALEPETVDHVEVSVESQWTRWLSLQGIAFVYQMRDAIANVTIDTRPGRHPLCGFVPRGGLCRQRRNLDRVNGLGVNWAAVVQLRDFVQLALNYAWTHTRIRDRDFPELNGRRVAQVPLHAVGGWLRLEHPQIARLFVSVRYESARFEDNENTLRLAPAWWIDLAVHRRVTSWATAYVAVENLLNHRIEVQKTPEGLVTLGLPRWVRFGIRITWPSR